MFILEKIGGNYKLNTLKAIIFDCFNVLVVDATKHMLEELRDIDPAKRQEFRAITEAYDKGIISEDEASTAQSELLGMSLDAFLTLRNQGEIRNDELITYIETVKGDFKLAMLSNIGSRARLDMRFLPGQIDQLFEVVVPSGEVGYVKPQPEIFQLTAQKLGVRPEECVMIDDIDAYCISAREVGMQAIHYVNNEQLIADLTSLIDRGEIRG